MKLLLSLLLTSMSLALFAQNEQTNPSQNKTPINVVDTIYSEELIETADSEEVQKQVLLKMLEQQAIQLAKKDSILQAYNDSISQNYTDSVNLTRGTDVRLHIDSTYLTLSKKAQNAYIDSMIIDNERKYNKVIVDSAYIRKYQSISRKAHPLLKELVFMPIELDMSWDLTPNFSEAYFGGKKPHTLKPKRKIPSYYLWTDTITEELHKAARREITRNNADLYACTFHNLPNTESFLKPYVHKSNTSELNIGVNDRTKGKEKIDVEKIKISKWTMGGNALAQFTQNYVSNNWYKGGNSNVSILGMVSGSVKYDNKKNVQWENFGEWRMGFNSVTGDTLRKISTNDDLFRLYSKMGIKAWNKFYYTASAEFKTQLFNTYKGANSPDLKTTFLSPIQANINLGLDYKHNKNLSILLAPVSYKYVYVHDTLAVSQNAFGVETGKKTLNQIGSSLRVEYTYIPIEDVSLVNKFYFYTNYQKVEIDWEITCNFIINRYLSTRILIHPRFDNTAIGKDSEKAKLQFREMISVGLSHKF